MYMEVALKKKKTENISLTLNKLNINSRNEVTPRRYHLQALKWELSINSLIIDKEINNHLGQNIKKILLLWLDKKMSIKKILFFFFI